MDFRSLETPETASTFSMALGSDDHASNLGGQPNILDLLTENELTTLVELGRTTTYDQGDFVVRQGDQHDGIHFIREGRVRSFYVSPAGREITLAYWPYGHFVGAPQILGGGVHMWSAVAVEKSIGLWLPGRTLRKLLKEMPNLSIALIDGLVYKSMCYTALVQIMGTQSKTNRLGHLLLVLAAAQNQTGNSVSLPQHFTQEELANMIGSTRQSISTSFDKFEKLGLIARDGDHLQIADIAGLRTFCAEV